MCFVDNGGTRRPNCITRVGEIFRVGQRAARSLPERWPAVPKRDCILRTDPRPPTRAKAGKAPASGTRASRVPWAEGGYSLSGTHPNKSHECPAFL